MLRPPRPLIRRNAYKLFTMNDVAIEGGGMDGVGSMDAWIELSIGSKLTFFGEQLKVLYVWHRSNFFNIRRIAI